MEASVYNHVPATNITKVTQEVSTLTFMDDSTLISQNVEGLEQMLGIANEFYNLNNTQANPYKYVLITNALKTPTPVTFNLADSSFTVTSLPPTQSFRFLGVWFSFSKSPRFVHDQIKSEYTQFNALIKRKLLTYAQISYLHNRVLIPKVEYRAQVSYLTQSVTDKAMKSFLRIFKNKCKLASSFLLAF
jgi:Reverse transcriptase (RNA-dependent DNA polymerase).